MLRKKTLSLKKQVEMADNQKKVNPLDLSSDQDLTIALMNLIAIDGKLQTVTNIQNNLLGRIVKNKDLLAVSERLLGKSIQLIEEGMKILENGQNADAYIKFDQAYEVYSLFWGVNMGMIEGKDVLDI